MEEGKVSIIQNEIKFVVKTCGPLLLLAIIVFLPSFGLSIYGLHQVIKESVPSTIPPEVRATIITNMVENLLIISIPTMTAIPIFVVTGLINSEKNDKVFEHLFTIPFPPLKLIFYRFISLVSVLILFIVMLYSVSLFGITIVAGNMYPLIVLRPFSLSLMLCLSVAYLVFFNGLLMPTKYFGLILMPIILLPQVIAFSTFGMLPNIGQNIPAESFCLGIVLASILITAAGLIETYFLKDKIVELAILAQ